MILEMKTNNKRNDIKVINDRGTAHPTVPKAGVTRKRRRLGDGGTVTT